MPSTSVKEVKHQKIGVVETIRGLAALAVCLFHFTKANIPFIGNSIFYQKIATNGWIGVEAFFVVSGFIIPYSLVKNNYKIRQFFKFLAKRCLRIEPPYLASIVLVIILGYVTSFAPGFKGNAFHFNAMQVASHIAYLPQHLGFEWLLPVYWSLEAEFHYYILIGLLLPLIWRNQVTLLIFFVISGGLSFFVPLYVFSFMPFFIMGIVVCAYKNSKVNAFIFWTVLICCFCACLFQHQPLIMPIAGIVTALLISYVELKTRVTDFLGKISFSLYLLHVPVGGKILNLAGRYIDTEWKVWASLILALGVTLLVSWIFYRLIEFPAMILSKRITYKKVEKSSDYIPSLPTS